MGNRGGRREFKKEKMKKEGQLSGRRESKGRYETAIQRRNER